jgi:hypothetical protein
MLLAATCLVSLTASLHAEDARPAGYIIATELQGPDQQAGTVVIRDGAELKPKIWMPLFAGDVVFLRNPASHVTLDMGDGGRVELGGALLRYEAKGEIATQDDAWSIITKIGAILASNEDTVVPENLASKGDAALISLGAGNGPNLILAGDAPVVLAWKGGAAPFRVTASVGARTHDIAETGDRLVAFAIPADAIKAFDVTISDAKGMTRRVPFRIRNSLPDAPASLAAAGPSAEFDEVLLAGWLAERPRGAWRFEALRRLQQLKDKDAAAAHLLKAMLAG